jgi:hypothetical protein
MPQRRRTVLKECRVVHQQKFAPDDPLGSFTSFPLSRRVGLPERERLMAAPAVRVSASGHRPAPQV